MRAARRGVALRAHVRRAGKRVVGGPRANPSRVDVRLRFYTRLVRPPSRAADGMNSASAPLTKSVTS